MLVTILVQPTHFRHKEPEAQKVTCLSQEPGSLLDFLLLIFPSHQFPSPTDILPPAYFTDQFPPLYYYCHGPQALIISPVWPVLLTSCLSSLTLSSDPPEGSST